MPKRKFSLVDPVDLEFKLKKSTHTNRTDDRYKIKVYDIEQASQEISKIKFHDKKPFKRFVSYAGLVQLEIAQNIPVDVRFIFGIVDGNYFTGKDIGDKVFYIKENYLDRSRTFETRKYWNQIIQPNPRNGLVGNNHLTQKIIGSKEYSKKLKVKERDLI